MKQPKVIRPLRNGQITIPAEFRQKLQIDENTLLQVILDGDELRIRPIQVTQATVGSEWARELYDPFAPVRKEAAQRSEDEVNADIHKAVAAARRKRAKSRS